MAKFYKADEGIVTLVEEIAHELGLENYIDFEVLDVPSLKEVVKVARANEVTEYISNRENLCLILYNGEAFDMLPVEREEGKLDNRYMWLRLAMDQIAYDDEKDKIIIGCPSINISVGCCEKYGQAAVDSALLAQYTLAQIAEKKEQEKAEKAAQKKEGKRKKK